MAVAITELIRRLKTRIQPYEKIPTPEQLYEAVKTAVSDLSDRSPFLSSTVIQIVANDNQYQLPTDFQSIYSFPVASGNDGGYFSGGNLYSSSSSSETVLIMDGLLTIIPTPTYNENRTLTYFAKYVPAVDQNGTETYAGMNEKHANAIVWRAVAICAQMKADKAAEQAWIQTDDQQRVDMSNKYKAFLAEAALAQQQWDTAVSKLSSGLQGTPYGSRSTYQINPYDFWAGGQLLEGDTY